MGQIIELLKQNLSMQYQILNELKLMNQKTDEINAMAQKQQIDAKSQLQETMAMYGPLLQNIINTAPKQG